MSALGVIAIAPASFVPCAALMTAPWLGWLSAQKLAATEQKGLPQSKGASRSEYFSQKKAG